MSNQLTKILYLEDDYNIAEVTVMTLEDIGDYEVIHCDSGQKALAEVEAFQPDLMLMDVMMPGMDGPEALIEMRKLETCKNIPVIFMTAKAQTHEQKIYMDMGALGVIMKPFDPMKLCEQVEAMWGKLSE